MINKNWFIDVDGQELGPFTFEIICTMIEENKIDETDLLRKEGAATWQPLFDWPEINSKDIPPLPPIPTIELEPESEPELEPELESEPEPEPEPEPELESALVENDDGEKFNDIYHVSENSDASSLRKGLVVFICILGIAISAYYFSGEKSKTTKAWDLSNSGQKALERVARKKNTGVNKFRFANNKSGNAVWMSSNISGPAIIYLKMTSVKGRITSDKDIVITSKAKLDSHYARFSNLNIEKGSALAHGEYEIEITGYNLGLKHKFTTWLGGLFSQKKHNAEMDLSLNYKKTILFSSSSLPQFEKKLLIFKKKIIEGKIKPFKERLMGYETFLNLLQKTRKLYDNRIKKIKRGKEIAKFEKNYNLEVGPLLQNLILDYRKRHLLLINSNPSASDAFEELMKFGKEIGSLAADMATQTKSNKRISKINQKKLQKKFWALGKELQIRGSKTREILNKTINNLNEFVKF